MVISIKTSVVDIHKVRKRRPEFDEYIGRSTQEFPRSKWANPYLSMPQYERHIRIRVITNPEYYDLRELVGRRLGCWCITTEDIYPIVCHGQVIMKLIEELT